MKIPHSDLWHSNPKHWIQFDSVIMTEEIKKTLVSIPISSTQKYTDVFKTPMHLSTWFFRLD